nr:MAG TPA: hypothetical protein [Caudoviricetes sp.]
MFQKILLIKMLFQNLVVLLIFNFSYFLNKYMEICF